MVRGKLLFVFSLTRYGTRSDTMQQRRLMYEKSKLAS
jgi:hypothetical protein